MKNRFLLSLFALSLTFSPFVGHAEEASKASKKTDKEDHKHHTELEEKMDKMRVAFRKLRDQANKGTLSADSLPLVAVLKENSEESFKLTPAKAADIPAGEREKFVTEYQAKMKDFLAEVAKLETAIKANQLEAAAKIIQTLGKMQKEGHKQFQKEED